MFHLRLFVVVSYYLVKVLLIILLNIQQYQPERKKKPGLSSLIWFVSNTVLLKLITWYFQTTLQSSDKQNCFDRWLFDGLLFIPLCISYIILRRKVGFVFKRIRFNRSCFCCCCLCFLYIFYFTHLITIFIGHGYGIKDYWLSSCNKDTKKMTRKENKRHKLLRWE